jgi:hypothetical protein
MNLRYIGIDGAQRARDLSLANYTISELRESLAKLVRQSPAEHRRKSDLPSFFRTGGQFATSPYVLTRSGKILIDRARLIRRPAINSFYPGWR